VESECRDPAEYCSQQSNQIDLGLRCQLIREWGLDKSEAERYVTYFANLLQGNWGTSITYRPGTPVLDVIFPRLLPTVAWVGLATAITMWLGVILGRVSGWRRGRPSDLAITLGGLVGYSMPTFWISLVLLFVFSVYLGIFPVRGDSSTNIRNLDFFGQIVDRLYHLALPILTFVISNFAIFTLTLRNSLTDVLTEDFMLTARAKGLTDREQLRWHALPNARLPVVTVGAFYFGWVLSGAILIEIVFSMPGIGRLEWDAVLNLDFPLMSGIFLLATLGVVIANAVADVLYVVLDPRVREA
jgi:peptide/nickel transport system permease protein